MSSIITVMALVAALVLSMSATVPTPPADDGPQIRAESGGGDVPTGHRKSAI